MIGEKDIAREGGIEPTAADIVADNLRHNLLKPDEMCRIKGLYRDLLRNSREVASGNDIRQLRQLLESGAGKGFFHRDKFGNSMCVRRDRKSVV